MNYLDCIPSGGIIDIREKLIKLQSTGQKVYRFESGDPSFSMHPKVKEAMKKALDQDKTHYIAVDGIIELKKAISSRSKKYGTDINPDDVFIVTGAMNGLYNVYNCLVDTKWQGSIAVPDPMWTEAVENIKLAGIDVCPISFDPKRENYTADVIADRAEGLISGIFINSPHNPTGRILTLEERKELIQMAIDDNMWIISDEAYETVLYEGTHTNLSALIPENYDKWVSIHSMSKAYAMPGLRIGWVITKNKTLKERLSKMLRCNINGVNSVTQWGAVEALSLDKDDVFFTEMAKEYRVRRDLMFSSLSDNDVLVPILPEGGFFLWCLVKSEYSASKVADKLASMGIGCAPGSCFGDSDLTKRSIRFSFSVDTQQVVEGCKVLKEVLKDESVLKDMRC